jgi:hypothetical protein
LKGIFLGFFSTLFNTASDSILSEDARIEPTTVATCEYGIGCQTL